MARCQYICKCEINSAYNKKPSPVKEVKILIPVLCFLPCDYPSIIETYDSKIVIDLIETKMLGTEVIITGMIKILIYYVAVDQQLHRVEFCIEFADRLDIKYYYRGIPKVIIKGIFSDFRLTDPVSVGCKSLGYQGVKGQVILIGLIKTPKCE